jgi:hypothetical protein
LWKDGKIIYMKVPHGFEKYYPDDVVLKVKKNIYRLQQAAMAFWRKLLLCKKFMEMVQNTADPCLYHKWREDGLVIIVLWIDNNLIIGSKKAVEKAKKDLMERFDCKDCGDLEEYVGCMIARMESSLKVTQPMLLQSYIDQIKLPTRCYKTPTQARSVLVVGKKDEALSPTMQTKYPLGTGKAMHEMQYSKPETYITVQDMSHHMHAATQDHYKTMLSIIKYSVDTAEQGLVIKPNRKWDGS